MFVRKITYIEVIMLHRSTIFFACIILSSSILRTSTKAEPLKGNNVTRVEGGKYPFVVSIVTRQDWYREEERHICTGALITKKFVLTAAHCFNGYSSDDIRLIVGSVDLQEGDKYDASMWISYNQWAHIKNVTKITGFNDVGIIKLSQKVHSPVEAAPLKFIKTYDLSLENVVLVGWGMTNESPKISSRYLMETRVKVLPNPVCEKISYDIFKKNLTFPSKYLCTKGRPYRLLAKGDSGGPVLMENHIVALHIGTCPNNGQCDLPEEVIKEHKFNMHAGIYPYKNFIVDIVKNY